MASLDKRPVGADQRLVRPVFWTFGVSTERMVVEKICGRQSVGLGSAFIRYAVLRCWEDCIEDGNLTRNAPKRFLSAIGMFQQLSGQSYFR